MNWRRIIFTIISCTLSCTLVSKAQAALASDERIWLIGDSEAVLIRPYLAKKAQDAGLTFGASPVAGSTVIQWSTALRREKWLIRHFKPTLVLVSLGANDACMGTRIIANEPPFLKSLQEQLGKTKARVVWIGPPKIGSTEPKLCWAMKDCLARAVPGLDAFKAMLTGAGEAYLDGRDSNAEMDPADLLHPTVKGRATWVDWIWQQLSG